MRTQGTHAVRLDERGKVIYMEDEIMENRLGRKLESYEVVRHKNGNALDNRDSNLEVVIILKPN